MTSSLRCLIVKGTPMKNLLRQRGVISNGLTVLLLILALMGIAMSFRILQNSSPHTRNAVAATCGCNPPPDTHGWTDNMCFHPHNTEGCPQTFAGGYCNPDGQGGYEDADWVRGYYEYREFCPNANLSPTRTAPTPTTGAGTTPTTTGSPTTPTVTDTPVATPTIDANANCWATIGDRFRNACKGDAECIRTATNLITKLSNYFGGACPNAPINPGDPLPSGVIPTGPDGSPFPTLPNGPIPVGLNDLLNTNTPPPDRFRASIQTCLANKNLYQQAVAMAKSIHGVQEIPWQLLSGIHFTEGSCNTNQSLISGRKIGAPEPDRAGTCSPQNIGPCRTVPIGTGCGYRTFLDSACDGTRILLQKSGGSITTVEQLAKGLAGYNGWGNTNCGKTPYRSCPPQFKGEDHPYPFNLFDARHTPMYLVYCADGVKCNPPREYTRPGALSVIKWVSWMDKN